MDNSWVYYFEIPVNAGEFALGSVEGHDGAYLIYLDLAANGTKRVSSTAAHSMTGINFIDDKSLADVQDYPIVAFGVSIDGTSNTHGGLEVYYKRQSSTSMTYDVEGGGSGAFDVTPMGGGSTVTFTQTDLAPPQAQMLSVDLERRRRLYEYA
jgi:hypothetical protein